MRNRFRSALFAATALGCVNAVSPALAQAETDTAQDVNPADQALAADEPIDRNAIIVTARRFEERLQDVPISITVFSQEQLNNRNIVNPSELATYTPSLSVNRQFGSEKSSFSIRGFVQELGTQPSVAVYFADVVAPRAASPTPSGNGTLPGTLFDLQNVQVLKGPQGTLFGRNTTGGAILFVPTKPTDRFEGYVEGSVGNYNSVRVQAVVNAPLGGIGAFRLGFDKMTREGYLRNRSGIGPDDFADVDYYAARASLLLDLTDNVENYTIATYNDSDTHGHIGRLIACPRDPALRGTIPGSESQLFFGRAGCDQIDRQAARGDGLYDVENDVPDPRVHLTQWQVINTTSWDVSDTLTIKNIASYGEFREATRVNLNGDRLFVPAVIEGLPVAPGVRLNVSTNPLIIPRPAPLPPLSVNLAGTPFSLVRIQPGPSGALSDQWTFTEELQFQGRSADERLTWQAGAYLEISRPNKPGTQYSSLFLNCSGDFGALQCVDPFALFSPSGAFGQLGLIDQTYRFRNYAGYAQATYDFTEQLSLTGGFRYTSDRVKATARNATVTFPFGRAPQFFCSRSRTTQIPNFDARGVCEVSIIEKSSRPTWLINLDYKPTPDTLIYAKYARGYRQGAVNLLPVSPALTTVGPEKVDTYEIGAKTSFNGALRGYFNVAAFYNDFTDQQIQANTVLRPGTPGFPVNVLVNAGKSRIYGVEIDASVRPFDGLQLDASYSYLNTKLKSFVPPDLSADPFYQGLIPTAVIGGPLAYSPKNRVSVTATYTLPIPEEDFGRMSIGATFTHTDRQFSSRADDAFVANGQLSFNPGRLPATDLLNLNVNWEGVGGHPIDLSLFATNVTNEKYRVAITNFFALGYESAILGEPRIYGARLRYRFGGLAE